ncbi:MAG TPA: hypothetical protein VKH43_06585, partial [Thermoanaerobaculia bacterium]|nr:hypothetical protein [Thermoanaerobaculia bacterium]
KTLMAQRLDAANGTLSGEPIPIVENIQDDPGFFTAVFTASDNGLLAYQESGGTESQEQMTWFDRAGKKLETVGTQGNLWYPRLSHDGKRVLATVGDPGDLWIEDLSRHVRARMTFDPADDNYGLWSVDDSRIYFMSLRSGGGDIYTKVSSGTAADERIFSSGSLKGPTSMSPDGRWLICSVLNPKTKWDLELYSLADRKMSDFLKTDFDELEGEFSPDGRWVAYSSNESGRYEVYVQPFPGPGGKYQISTGGGGMPVWRRDGKELFYLAADQRLMAVPVQTGATFEPGSPAPLFAMRQKNDPDRHFDVSADGQRFLVAVPVGEEVSLPVTLIQNWTNLLRERR